MVALRADELWFATRAVRTGLCPGLKSGPEDA